MEVNGLQNLWVLLSRCCTAHITDPRFWFHNHMSVWQDFPILGGCPACPSPSLRSRPPVVQLRLTFVLPRVPSQFLPGVYFPDRWTQLLPAGPKYLITLLRWQAEPAEQRRSWFEWKKAESQPTQKRLQLAAQQEKVVLLPWTGNLWYQIIVILRPKTRRIPRLLVLTAWFHSHVHTHFLIFRL